MKIALIGATGHIGSRILKEAAARGHQVTAIARTAESLGSHPNVTPKNVDLFDTPALTALLSGHDAVLVSYSPGMARNQDADILEQFVRAGKAIIAAIKGSGVKRVQWVGGAASLKLPNGKVLLDSDQWPPQFNKNAVRGVIEYRYMLKAEPDLDWVMLSPSIFIEPGQRTGKFRLEKENLLFDAAGRSHISMEDFAVAMIDELEHPQHHRERFTVGY
ncbi:MAG: NAD(P)-dependent oxidoreductase [Gammaproteobacteria bacterium]